MRVLAAVLAVLALAAPAYAARSFQAGFFDGSFADADAARLDEAAASGATIVRVPLDWPSVATRRPADPRNPADPAYRWTGSDVAIAAAQARGLAVLLTIDNAPRFAEGAHRPKSVGQGTWKPSAKAAGVFVEAVARHFPQVHYIQLWNEPNLAKYLAPQWRKGRPFAPVRYRAMLNAAYKGIHAAGTGAKLVTAGTAPYGDPDPGGLRIMPVRFWRTVFARPVHFDILAHHPYAIEGPRRHALNAGDVAIPDMGKLTRLVRRAVRAGKVLPRTRKRFWVTEMSWDSKPPDPQGVPAKTQARWLADAFYVLFKQGVDAVLWFQVRDQAPVPSYAATNQSGVYLRNGVAKPSQAAFAFPFACDHGRVWALAPTPGPVLIEDARGNVVRTLTAGTSRIVQGSARGRLHAVSGGKRSISCSA